MSPMDLKETLQYIHANVKTKAKSMKITQTN